MALDLSGFAGAAKGEPAPAPDTFTAIVVRADESGLWVAVVGEDTRHPVGPCRGGWTANGTRVPPGATVMLAHTPDGPWVTSIDNPAHAISDATLAPFPNPSFETVIEGSVVPDGWSDFWSSARRRPAGNTDPDTYQMSIEEGGAVLGLRSVRVDARETYALLGSATWAVPAGSSLEASFYARAIGPDPRVELHLYSSTPAGSPGPFGAESIAQVVPFDLDDQTEWLRYRATYSLPPTHTRVALYVLIGADQASGSTATIWVDNFDADIVDLDPAAANQDYLRRAVATLTGGGHRTVTAGGNVSWSQPFTIAGAGLTADVAPGGRFEISMPANGTVVPVHQSSARTTVTVTGGAILLLADEALWYELPIGAAAASQAARFHVLGSTLDDGYVAPAHWILVVRRTTWSSTAHACEYVWGDAQQQDPARTPSLNAGWVEGTVPPRFSKEPGGRIRLTGRVKDGTGSAFTLIPGYRPAVAHDAVVRDGAGVPALLTITTGGVVTTTGSNADHSINTTFVAGP